MTKEGDGESSQNNSKSNIESPTQAVVQNQAIQDSKNVSYFSKVSKVVEWILNKSKELYAFYNLTAALIIVFLGGIASVINFVKVPSPNVEYIPSLKVDNTIMAGCIFKNNGLVFETDIRVTLRPETLETYEINFSGAEGFANVVLFNGNEQLITENETIKLQGVNRLIIDRLAQQQKFIVTIKSSGSNHVSCEPIGSSGQPLSRSNRILVIDNYALILLVFVISLGLVLVISEAIRSYKENRTKGKYE